MPSNSVVDEPIDFSLFSTDSVVMSLQEFAETLDAPQKYLVPDELREFVDRASKVIEAASPEQFAGVNLQIGGFLKEPLLAKDLPKSGRRIMCSTFDSGRPSAATFLHGPAAIKWLARPSGQVELASIHEVIAVLSSGANLYDSLCTYVKSDRAIFLPTVTTDCYLRDPINATFASILRLDRSKTKLGVDIDDFDGHPDDLLMSFLQKVSN